MRVLDWLSSRAADFAAAVVFYGVHAGIGGADDGVDGVLRRAGGDAYAGAGSELKAAVHAEAGVDEFVVKISGGKQSFSRRGFGHHDYELVASITEAHVFGAGDLFEARANAAKEFAADEMAVCVVDGLESVEIDKGEADRFAVAVRVIDLLLEDLVEMANVVEACSVVGDGELLDSRDVLRILDGDSGMIAEDVKEGDRVVAHLAGARIENFDDTLNAFASAEGHGDDRTNDALVGT